MKFKKLLASSLLCGLCIFSSIPVHASEVEGPDTGIQRTEAALTDGVTRASWGTGTLIHENPLGRKPWAYAKTSTYAGNAYSILLNIIFLCKFAISRTATTSCHLLCPAFPDHAVVLLTDTFVPLSYATVAPDPSISGS